MPSPHVPDPSTGTSRALPSAASIFPCRSDLSLSFRIHPTVVENVIAHYTRVMNQDALSSGATAAQPPRIFGCLIGKQHITKVDIYNSFELVVDPVSGTLDSAFFEKQQELYKRLFPGWNVRGWYSTGSYVQDTDMKIHRAVMVWLNKVEEIFYWLEDSCIDKLLDVHDTPVYLLLNPAMGLSQTDVPVTIYESDRRVIDRRCMLVFVRPNHTVVVLKETLSTEVHLEETASAVIATMPHEEGENAGLKRCSFRRMLLETPSGFAMFGIDDKVFKHPEDIWACFTDICDARDVIFFIGFLEVSNKHIARDTVAGPGEDLANFILQFCNKKGLIVQDLELQEVIQTNLGVKCWFSKDIVSELIWGLKFVLHEFIPGPEGKKKRIKKYFPLSKELEKATKVYGFNIPMHMIPREFICMFGRLKYFEDTSDVIFKLLHERFANCLSGSGSGTETDMSKIEFVEAVGNLLSTEPSVIIQDEMYSKEDMLRAIDSFLAAPKQTEYLWLRLRHMELQIQLFYKKIVDSGNAGRAYVESGNVGSSFSTRK